MRVTDHDFAPVLGHSDDDECTHRADGTDATYCGEPRVRHEWDDGYCKECREWFVGRHLCWDNA